ncbi:RagB/SusD family nutrient uptake outer membrane protein [Pedobacter sp. GR22-6]|uniref:RagB/SusD family nutrient uptake outer membrane protein n=1 Tax=Pedobacter sp. GR22-6 TaxID=3127957 RepID=UPI00307E3B42
MKNYLYILFPVLLVLSACEKLLNKEPTDQLSIEELFSDMPGSKSALAGAYKGLMSSEYYGMKMMIYPDLMAGNLKFSKTTNTRLDDVYQFNCIPDESAMNDTYRDLYSQLNNVNNIIYYVPSASGTDAERTKLIAEAKCIRALLHFDLLRIFTRTNATDVLNQGMGIALNLKPQLYADPSPVRATLGESYSAIVKDLTEAISVFDDANAGILPSGNKQNYFTKSSAKALLAKVYLYQQNWDAAFSTADELIKNGGYSLTANANYVASWATKTPATESIFELPFEQIVSGTTLSSYYSLNDNTYRMYAVSNDLLGLYSSTDVRGSATMFNLLTTSTYRFTKKYADGGTLQMPIKVLRLSELYLIRAEAALEKAIPDFVQANADLSAIARRANPALALSNITDKAQLIDAILLERRKELAFEGNLLFDLVRRKKGISRTDGTATTMSLDADDHRMIMPIPKATTDVNIHMIQNLGY